MSYDNIEERIDAKAFVVNNIGLQAFLINFSIFFENMPQNNTN